MFPHVGIVERRRRWERKSKWISSARYWFFFSMLPPGHHIVIVNFFSAFLLFSFIFAVSFLLFFLKNWFYLNLFSYVLKLIQFYSAKTELLIVRSENDKDILRASENKYLPLFFFLFSLWEMFTGKGHVWFGAELLLSGRWVWLLHTLEVGTSG